MLNWDLSLGAQLQHIVYVEFSPGSINLPVTLVLDRGLVMLVKPCFVVVPFTLGPYYLEYSLVRLVYRNLVAFL